jgi:aminoglycoside phosphotransferase (APT) family kinase protein
LEAPELEYAEGPQPITGGFDTLTYSLRLDQAPEAFRSPLILRVFRADHPSAALSGAERANFESVAQNTIGELGYPAPRVLQTCTDAQIIGAPFLIMERLPGSIMLDLFFRPSRVWARLPSLLAEAHACLHSLDGAVLRRTIEDSGLPIEALAASDLRQVAARTESASLDGLRPGVAWLVQHELEETRPPVICHGDFHPLNVLMDKGEVSGVIDWTYVRLADVAYDVGATIALFGQGPIDLPGVLQPPANWFRRWVVRRYYRAYRQLRNLDESAVRYYEALRCIGFLVEAGEHLRAARDGVPPPEKPTAFSGPRTVRNIVRRIRELTGVNVSVP